MREDNTRTVSIYFLWVGCLAIVLIFLPHYLGTLIAQNQWQMLSILIFGAVLAALYFMEGRYLILGTYTSLLLAVTHVGGLASLFGTLRWIFLGALAVRGVGNWFLGRVPARVRFVDLWAVVFLALAFYSQSYSIMPDVTFQRSAAALLFYVAIFWGVWSYAQDTDKITFVVEDLLKLAFFVLFVGPIANQSGRFVGFFSNPNAFGLFVALLVPLALWSWLCRRNRFAFYLLCLMSVGLVLSRSRAGLLSAAFAAGYFLVFYYRKHKFLVIPGVVLLVTLVSLLTQIFGSSMVEDYVRWHSLLGGSGRTEAWKEVFRLIQLRPWLGYGFGTEDYLFLKFDILFLEHAGAYAHNSYIGLTSQLGFLGASLFFVPVMFFFIRRTLRLRHIPPGDEPWLNLALNASILAGFVNALFESWMYTPGSAFNFSFWVFVMLAYQLDLIRSVRQAVPLRQGIQ